MNYRIEHKKNQINDRRNSTIITFFISLLIFLFIFYYEFSKVVEIPQELTTMLINFGDTNFGNSNEEPLSSDGSVSFEEKKIEETEIKPDNSIKPSEKILTGNNKEIKVSVKEVKKEKPSTSIPTKVSNPQTKVSTKSQPSKSDTKGNNAIGNLIKGRSNSSKSQGNSNETGNSGDPLGGDSNGDSKIGVDRKLIGFIPGTMGRGGSQPFHSCSASGSILISYVVNGSGNVTSAKRLSGISDPCIVSTSVSWVQQYVKAEKSNTSSTGTYKITF